MLRCPDCGCEVSPRTVVTRLDDIEGWSCLSCGAFYSKMQLNKAILTV